MRTRACTSLMRLLALLSTLLRPNLAFTTPASSSSLRISSWKRVSMMSSKTNSWRSAIVDGQLDASVRYSSKEWLACLVTWPKSSILGRIRMNILAIALWTVLLNLALNLLRIKLSFPFFIHTIAGSALSLLLVFKTNTSYDRFYEGRKLWGSIVGACRGYARLAYVHMDKRRHREVATLLVVFCNMLRQHLRKENTPTDLLPYLHPEDIRFIAAQRHRPLMVLRRLEQITSEVLTDSRDPLIAYTLGTDFRQYVNALGSSMGSCERIIKAPTPYFYAINTSRFLSLYLFTLPFAIIPHLGWYTVPTIMAISWCFISIQEIGHMIEDPFNMYARAEIIAMQDMTAVVQANVSGNLSYLL